MQNHLQRQKTGPSQRQLRVGELLRRRLCDIFTRDDIGGVEFDARLITITQVDTSPDLRQATAYIMPLGGANLEQVTQALNQLAPQLRGAMSKGLRLKYVPQLVFKPDTSFANAETMDALFARADVRRDIAPELTAEQNEQKKQESDNGKTS
ncbi:MAG: 30S ribosome-binding factor RbfA [Alphaproteobacteria bacterium]|nr:30S ribosome-binding factor RbfA [Alphaproteobacteria bacterium]